MSDCEEFDLGDDVRVSGVFKDTNGDEGDPTAVTFKFRPPGAASPTIYVYGTDGELVRDSLGNYHVDIDADLPGTWKWRWIAEGSIKSAKKGSFRVGEDI